MRIDFPTPSQIPQLRRLWKEAFSDEDAFLDQFFSTAFSSRRCRCVELDGQIAAGLYWLDCWYNGGKIAYIYAVATGQTYRGQGLCAALMADTHTLLTQLGYAGAILVPGDEGLFRMYGKMGYQTCSHISVKTVSASKTATTLRRVCAEEYAQLRRLLLPDGGVIQEGENLSFLEKLTHLYAGEGFIFCAALENGRLSVPELLGDITAAEGIVAALGATEGTFRYPGQDRPFAMYCSFSSVPMPQYFGLAFD